MIVILDYDMGNVCSIQNMLKKIGAKSIISNDPAIIEQADKIILPGVGKFDAGMEQLHKYNLIDIIKHQALVVKKPVLGICLGMQLLGESSEEGLLKGLSLIPFKTLKFKLDSSLGLKVPHMGWDYVNISKTDNPLMYELSNTERYYFVHSYHAVCDNPNENQIMSCDYGYEFSAAISSENIYGVQFHPEKSHKYGMKLLENFVSKV